MLSVEAAKLVLTLHSVPPFLIESILSLALVVLLAVPLIAHLQLLLQSGAKSRTTLARQNRHRRSRNNMDHCGTNQTVVMHYPVLPVKVDSSSNSDLNVELTSMRKTCSTPTIKQMSAKGNADNNDDDEVENRQQKRERMRRGETAFFPSRSQLAIIDISAFDYDSYRHKLIEASLKRQYGDRQAPGNVVLNSINLNSISSQSGIELSERYSHSLFDFIEEYYETSKAMRETNFMHPLDHFLAKGIAAKPSTAERATETNGSISELDQLPELLNFRDKSPTPPKPKPAKLRSRRSSMILFKNVQTKSSNESVTPSYCCRATSQHCSEAPSSEKDEVSSSEAASSYCSSSRGRRLVRSRASSLNRTATKSSSHTRQWYVGGKTSASFNKNYSIEPTSKAATEPTTKRTPRPRSSGGIFAWEVPDVPTLTESTADLGKETSNDVSDPPPTCRKNKITSESFVKSSARTSRVPVAKCCSTTKSANGPRLVSRLPVQVERSRTKVYPPTRSTERRSIVLDNLSSKRPPAGAVAANASVKNIAAARIKKKADVNIEKQESAGSEKTIAKRPFLRARSGKHGAPKQIIVSKQGSIVNNNEQEKQLSRLASKESKADLVTRHDLKTYISKIKLVLSNRDETLRAADFRSLDINEAMIPEFRPFHSPQEIKQIQGLVDRMEKHGRNSSLDRRV